MFKIVSWNSYVTRKDKRAIFTYSINSTGPFAVVCQSKPYKQVKRVEEIEEQEEPEQERYPFNTVTYKLDKVAKEGDFKESKDKYEIDVNLMINNNKICVQIDS